MENAAKALTIAGGVFIALMILGALILMFSNLSSYQNQNDASAKQTQIAEFNNQYMPYDKENLTLMELKSLYNKIESNNTKNPDEQINTNIREKCQSVGIDIESDFKKIQDEQKMNRVFRCSNIKYNSEGKINEMTFENVN